MFIGTFKWDTGEKYKGEYHRSKRHGYGTFTWINGKIYKGHWLNGKQHGGGEASRGGISVETEYKLGNLMKSNRNT